MSKRYVLLILFTTAYGLAAMAQKTIRLYEGASPGLLPTAVGVKEINTTPNNPIQHIRHITTPTLTVYSPTNKLSDAAVIICPGGGYQIVALNHEGDAVAEWFAQQGITAFVLKYRLPQAELFENPSIRPLEDVQNAIAYVKLHAQQYGINEKKVGIMGFSAGGNLAATASTQRAAVGQLQPPNTSLQLAFSILIYPVISMEESITHQGSRESLLGKNPSSEQLTFFSAEKNVGSLTPPTFLVHTFDDFVSINNSINYLQALKQHNIVAEAHFYDRGGHGYSLTKQQRGPVETWPDRLLDWLRINGWR